MSETEKDAALLAVRSNDELCRVCSKCRGSEIATKLIKDGDTVNTSSLSKVTNEFCYSIEYEIYYKVKAKKEHLQHKCKCGNLWREAVAA